MLHGSKKIIKHKVGLLNLAEELGNVSQACRIMGLSRDTFYRYKSAVDENGLDALFDKSRRKPNIRVILKIMFQLKLFFCFSQDDQPHQELLDPIAPLTVQHFCKRGC